MPQPWDSGFRQALSLPGDIFIGPVPGPSSHRFRVVIWLCTLTCLPYLPSRRPSFRISRSSNVSCFAALLHTYLSRHTLPMDLQVSVFTQPASCFDLVFVSSFLGTPLVLKESYSSHDTPPHVSSYSQVYTLTTHLTFFVLPQSSIIFVLSFISLSCVRCSSSVDWLYHCLESMYACIS